jgi:membrane protein implicated in regulation of membrane protease activity
MSESKNRKIVTTLLVNAASIFLTGLLVMVALGALHHEASSNVPNLSYWATVAMLAALRGVVGGVAEAWGSNRRLGEQAAHRSSLSSPSDLSGGV